MSMDVILDRVRREVWRVLRLRAEARMARVSSFDPVTHAIKAQVLPEADFPINDGDIAETGWIPHGPVAGGNGWGVYAPPLPGTQIMLTHSEGVAGAAVGVTTVNDLANPPPGAAAGEIWLVHSSTKTWIKLTNDGNTAQVVDQNYTLTITNGSLTITSKGNINMTAPTVAINGELTVTKDIVANGEVIAGGRNATGVALTLHAHTGVQAGGNLSGPPLPGS